MTVVPEQASVTEPKLILTIHGYVHSLQAWPVRVVGGCWFTRFCGTVSHQKATLKQRCVRVKLRTECSVGLSGHTELLHTL
jgi:hypothetical protein